MKNEDLDKVRQFIKTPKGKALLFFGFYFIFFILIGTSFRGESSSGIESNSENNSSFDFNLKSITSNNFKFNYDIIVDDLVISYNGSKYDNKENFNIQEVNYYKENENYFINTNGVWLKCENPYLYSQFYKSDNILSLLGNASYISKTEYDSGKNVYNFSLASATINKLFENNDLDIEEIPNEILVSVDEDGYVNKIKFKLDSYCKVKNICMNSMIVELTYDDYGKIEEIISPLGKESQ